MVSLSNHNGVLTLPFDKLRVSEGLKMYLVVK